MHIKYYCACSYGWFFSTMNAGQTGRGKWRQTDKTTFKVQESIVHGRKKPAIRACTIIPNMHNNGLILVKGA